MPSDTHNVTVNFADPTPGACTPSQMQTLINQLNGLVSGDITDTGNTSFYNFGDTEPTPENRLYPWLKTISGYPDNWYVYVDGAWRPVNPQRVWFCGNAGGIIDVYTATTQQPYSSTVLIQVGDIFTVKILIANDGPSTLAVNGFPAAPIQVESLALVGTEMVANETYIFLWDGTFFRLLNPTPVVQPVALTKSFVSLDIPIGAAGTTGTPVPHGLLEMPKVLEARLKCTSADVGIAPGVELQLKDFQWHFVAGSQDEFGCAISIECDAVNLTPLWNWNGSSNDIFYKTVGSTQNTVIDTTKWVLVMRAFA